MPHVIAQPTLELGVYGARRAAALSGVPFSTVHDWARKGVVVPSVSIVRTKLWSYSDLLALRAVSWLRKLAAFAADRPRRATPMRDVRQALAALREMVGRVWSRDDAGLLRCALLVDPDGTVLIRDDLESATEVASRQVRPASLNVFAEFHSPEGKLGPNLVVPREHLRIIPGKLAGEPHIAGTRLDTRSVYGMTGRGLDLRQIMWHYPQVSESQLANAIALEEQLADAA